MALEEPKAGDQIMEVDHINIAFGYGAYAYLQHEVLDYQFWGTKGRFIFVGGRQR